MIALLCAVLVFCEAKQVPNNKTDISNSHDIAKLKTWSLSPNAPPNDDGIQDESLETFEEDPQNEAETIRPLVLNPNSTLEQYQAQPNKRFWEWILNFWNGGGNNPGNNHHPVNNQMPPTNCSPCKCGHTNTLQRIVGGVVTKVNQWPWVVELRNNNRFYCGGSVVNSRYVLTAAHCTVGVAKERILAVFFEHDRTDSDETKTFTRKITNIYRHARYNEYANYNNDISLLRLETPLTFTDRFRPVCLPVLEQSYAGSVGTVTGWGATAEYGSTSNLLREVNVPIISNEDCRKTKYGNKITANMLCAGFIGKGGKDACQGDSGGPLQVANGTRYAIVGIVSWGEGCAERDYPGVYTRVNRFLSWIKANTKDSCYCN